MQKSKARIHAEMVGRPGAGIVRPIEHAFCTEDRETPAFREDVVDAPDRAAEIVRVQRGNAVGIVVNATEHVDESCGQRPKFRRRRFRVEVSEQQRRRGIVAGIDVRQHVAELAGAYP